MIPRRFEDISKCDIDALVANGVPEGRTIDYKRSLPGGTDEDKREFLADVSSLANAAGGDLVYGVTEEKGIPTSADGLAGIDPDAELLRLDNIIRHGIDPRVPGVQIKAVRGFPHGEVIVLRVPRSWASPHMVTFKNWSRFFSRTNAGKFQMDLTEIRAAFLLSEAIPERMAGFRDDRLSKIIADETPLPMLEGGAVVLHLVPVSAFAQRATIDVAGVPREGMPPIWSTNSATGWDGRLNLDGLVTYRTDSNEDCLSYLQLFRRGILEAVEKITLAPEGPDGRKVIPPEYEAKLVEVLPIYLGLLRDLGLLPPILVFLTLLGARGYTMDVPRREFEKSTGIDRETLVLPEVVVDAFDAPPATVMKPVFDIVWQAAGLARSWNYDQAGNWNPRRR